MIRIIVCLCFCVSKVFGQGGIQFQPGMIGTQTGFQGPGFSPIGTQTFQPQPGMPQNPAQTGTTSTGFGSPFTGPMVTGGMPFGPGSVFGPMGPLRPLSPPLSPMAMMMASLAQNPNNYRYATCNFNDTWSTIRGRMDLRQFLIGEGRQQVQIRLQLSGLPPSVSEVERGLHIHEFGDIGDGCARVGPHFNPNQTPHGSQRNFAFLRHVGDLGNIKQSADGLVSTQFVDQVISLEGSNNVVGRSVVVKLERDDLGLGGSRESRVNGNTHNPLACCTIGRTTARNWYNPMSATDIQNMAVTGMMPDSNTDPFNTNTMVNTGMNTGGMPTSGFPGTGFQGTGPGINTGFPGTGPGVNTGFPGIGPGVNTGFPGTGPGINTGFQGTGPGVNTGFQGTGPGINTGFQNTGINTGFPQIGGGPQTGFGNTGTLTQPGFGSQPGFGTSGLTQQGFGSPVGFGTGGLTQSPSGNMGLTQSQPGNIGLTQSQSGQGLTQTGLTQSGFSGTGINPNQQTFGAGTFMPGAAPGQTFNFAAQGKKKK